MKFLNAIIRTPAVLTRWWPAERNALAKSNNFKEDFSPNFDPGVAEDAFL